MRNFRLRLQNRTHYRLPSQIHSLSRYIPKPDVRKHRERFLQKFSKKPGSGI